MLSLALLLAQQAGLLHELGHFSKAHIQDTHEKQVAGKPCALCLAFGQLDANAATTPIALNLLEGLRHVWAASFAVGSRETTPLEPRNRGPPLHL